MSTVAPSPSRSGRWLDGRGKGALAVAAVLGFAVGALHHAVALLVWPVGLAALAFLLLAGGPRAPGGRRRGRRKARRGARGTGNTAFDAHRVETLRRLEEEQEAFGAFLERLHAAKDQSEFDRFMEDRARSAADAEPARA